MGVPTFSAKEGLSETHFNNKKGFSYNFKENYEVFDTQILLSLSLRLK